MAPTRDYFYEVDLGGRLFHDGTELSEARFLDFFFRRLRDNDTGRFPDYPFLSPCGTESNFLRPADRPVVFHHLRDDHLNYAATLTVPFDPATLRVSPEGRLYHPAPVGELGLMASRLVLQLGEGIRERDGDYFLVWSGREHPVLPT